MTSGTFHIIPLDSIVVKRDERQRRDLSDIDVLADSIRRLGLIHPLVVTRDERELIAGERRFNALKALRWATVPVQYVDELDPAHLRAIELEENIKRQDISWQDQVRAVREYHALRAASAAAWTQTDTATAIGVSKPRVNAMLQVAEELVAGNKMIIDAPKLSTAEGIVRRANERRDQQSLDKLHESLAGDKPVQLDQDSILNVDFITWVQTVEPFIQFNFIHCDFPYGIQADKFVQGAASAHGGYDDTPETWSNLIAALQIAGDRLTAPSAHLMFWFAMRKGDTRLYEWTVRALEMLGWTVNPLPLIWMKSDGVGIIPDPERGPRQIYETCLLGSRGDRKIVRAVANAYHSPTVRDHHMSEKPEPMLRHFFSMLVDSNTIMLDPTCGSGSSLRAAESLGAKYVQGIEINSDFANVARDLLKRARRLKTAEGIVTEGVS